METKYDQYCTTLSLAVLSTHYRCHLGKSIVYDTVSNLSWSVDVRTHGIVNVIDNILGKPWPPADEVGREVPEPQLEVDCVVRLLCFCLGSQYSLTCYAVRIVIVGNLETIQNRDLPTMRLKALGACCVAIRWG